MNQFKLLLYRSSVKKRPVEASCQRAFENYSRGLHVGVLAAARVSFAAAVVY